MLQTGSNGQIIGTLKNTFYSLAKILASEIPLSFLKV